jgi:Tfp pilus assembly protein PilO
VIQRLKSLLDRLRWSHVALIVGVGAAAFYFMQDNSEIEQREQGIQSELGNIASLERKIKEAQDFERQFEEKKRRYSELVKSLQDLKEALPRQFFLPDLLSDLLREAKALEVEITKIIPDQREEQGELYNTLGFNIEAKGTFIQFFIFLDRMAHMSRLINVENYRIDKDSSHAAVTLGGLEGSFAGTNLSGGRTVYSGISASIRVLTYRYRGGAGVPATPAATSPPTPLKPGGK